MSTETLLSVGDCIRWGEQAFINADLFFGHGTDNAWDEAVYLVLHSLNLPWDSDASIADQPVSEPQRKAIITLLQRRIDERVPAPYLTGEAWFAGYPFLVDTSVLVPRSPIAELISDHFEPWVEQPPRRILDLCTGCGCIGIVCALVLNDVTVDLSDISTDALSVAARNIQRHGVGDRTRTIHSDLFSAIKGNTYDLIVTNPPYVDANDLSSMPAEYRAEPDIALGSGADGLDFTRALLRQAANYLTDNGVLIAEVGNSGQALAAAYPNMPFLWLEFSQGGHGVFVLTAQQLRAYQWDSV